MRILEVCNIASDFKGSFINSIIQLQKLIQDSGDEIDFLFPITAINSPWIKELSNESKIYFIDNSNGIKDLKLYFKIFHILLKNKYDIIHSHYEGFDIPVTIINNLMFFRKAKTIWHCHDAYFDLNDLNRNEIDYLKKYYVKIGKNVEFIVINDSFKKDLISLGVPRNNITVIENGIYIDDLNIVELPSTETNFVTTGWNFYIKGVDIILNACEILNNNHYEFKMYINGNEKMENEIKSFYNKNIPNYIEIQKPQRNRNEIFKNKSAFIQASRHETFSYSVCEASYVGLPVICNSIDGLLWAKELCNVKFFKKNDSYDLSKKMIEVINNKTFESLTSRQIIEKKYTSHVWTQNIYTKYREILSKGKK